MKLLRRDTLTDSCFQQICILEIVDSAIGGGAEKVMRMQAAAFSELDINVIAVYPPGKDAAAFKKLASKGITLIEYPVKQKNILKTILFVFGIIRKYHVNIIHTHLYFSDFIALMSSFFLFRIKRIATVHMFSNADPPRLLLRKIQVYICTFVAYLSMHSIFVVSNQLKQYIRKRYLVNPKKLATIINGIDFSEMSFTADTVDQVKKEFSISANDIILVNVGILSPLKGQQFLVEAIGQYLKDLPIKCFLIGADCGLSEALKDRIDKYDLSNVVFMTGYRRDIASWLACASCYIQPTLNDAMPLSIIEAMYMHLPVIATDLDTLHDLVIHEKTALVVKRGEAKPIADAIRRIVFDEALRTKLSSNGHKFVIENCSIDAAVKKMSGRIFPKMNQQLYSIEAKPIL